MLYYGESDYWVAQYRSMTEGSAQRQTHSAEDPRLRKIARSTTLLSALFRRIVPRGGEKKAGLDG